MATVVAIGEALLRLSAPDGERLESARSLDVYLAGSEANVAAGLAHLGVATSWVSTLPRTPVGRRIAGELAAAGVDLQHVRWVPEGRVGTFFVERGASPRPTTVWYDRAGSTFAQMDSMDGAVLDGARFAVLSGITPALGEPSRRLAAAFMQEARQRGVETCIDVNYRERLWKASDAKTELTELLSECSVPVCSERDAHTVFGLRGTEQEVLDEFMRFTERARLVVLTKGALGCSACTREGERLSQPGFVVPAIRDAFGIGDAFLAGLIWGLLDSGVASDALRAGAALAALKSTIAGDFARFASQELVMAIAAPTGEIVR